jgi:O-antigen/teichoic acid export membrane protein
MAVWAWVLNYADRYLLRLYLTDADVGQYTMGYSLGAKLLLLATPLLAFLSPQILALRRQNQAPSAANPLLLRYMWHYVVLAGLACLVFALSRDQIGILLLSERYSPAFAVAPIVALGYLFLTSIHLLELKWYTFGQTRNILWHSLFGVIINLALNVLLIPRLGLVGAAWATAIGYAAQFALAHFLFTHDATPRH